MANDEHVALLKKGVDAWNAWRDENPDLRPDLDGAYLQEANLRGANLHEGNLRGAHLAEAGLTGADLSRARLIEADLSEANLSGANLSGAILAGADLRGALLLATVFGNTALIEVKGLNDCRHLGPSIIDFHTLKPAYPALSPLR